MFALHGLVWPHMVLLLFTAINMFGPMWPCVAVCGLVWPCVAFCGLVWSCMVSLWPYVVFHGRISSFLAVIDPNSFDLVSFRI